MAGAAVAGEAAWVRCGAVEEQGGQRHGLAHSQGAPWWQGRRLMGMGGAALRAAVQHGAEDAAAGYGGMALGMAVRTRPRRCAREQREKQKRKREGGGDRFGMA